tara:strand:+ start:171 stop:1022 length:852 start_codon:yes stop_codon:yes gene_type:complete
METSREDVGIVIRSAFLRKENKQRFSIFVLIIISALLIFFENIRAKPVDKFRTFVKDVIYRGSSIVSYPSKFLNDVKIEIKKHNNVYKSNENLKKENKKLKQSSSKISFLELENAQLRKLLDEQVESKSNLFSARVLLDKQSPYLNSFIINSGSNKKIKNGMAVLDGANFVGRIVDVNYFTARVLLISDLNSKIPIVVEPGGQHAILYGRGKSKPTLEYLPENVKISDGDKVYTSGKEGIFSPGIPIGKVKIEDKTIFAVSLFSELDQITFVNINLGDFNQNK